MKITVFGEILWDISTLSGDGRSGVHRTIGGAPFNLAAHASMLGAEANLISAVGKDELGEEALAECAALGINTGAVAITGRPTGSCIVSLKNGMPSYDLVEGCAYDYIPVPQVLPETDVFCFGTLAQRNRASALTLCKLLEFYKNSTVFCDINIRQNYHSSDILKRSLAAADIVKVSREEAPVLGIPGTPEEISRELLKMHPKISLVLMTLDSDGAFAALRDGQVIFAQAPPCNVVSTVGAGDSFSAGFLVSYLGGAGAEKSLENAVKLASFVCENVGAVCSYPDWLKADYSALL